MYCQDFRYPTHVANLTCSSGNNSNRFKRTYTQIIKLLKIPAPVNEHSCPLTDAELSLRALEMCSCGSVLV